MESMCKVFLAPRARDGEPDVLITRQPNGLLLAAVSCTCPPDGDCKKHSADELLKRARDHHERVAQPYPCTFKMNWEHMDSYEQPLAPCPVWRVPVPTTSPYGPATAESAVAADPENVTPGKIIVLKYRPPHSFPGLVFKGRVSVEYHRA